MTTSTLTQESGIPSISVSWDKTLPLSSGLTISSVNFEPAPVLRKSASKAVAIFGCPIIEGVVDLEKCADKWMRLERKAEQENFIRQLNGQFLFIASNFSTNQLEVINDRFNGVPFYYSNYNDVFLGSLLYYELFRKLRSRSDFSLNQPAVFEYVYLQRLLGDKTYDNNSKFLPAASWLEIKIQGHELRRKYWTPDFTKKIRGKKAAGEEFTSLLRQSVTRRTSDQKPKRYGLFLSGGHDSRTLLSAFKTPPTCFTVAFSDNYEVACARRVAKAVGAEHHFLKLEDDHLIKHQKVMQKICGGLYTTDNAFFVGLREKIRAHVDVVFHGHALDYLFQGMYLPCSTVRWLGRPTFFRRLNQIHGSVAEYYLRNIPFRIVDTDLMDLLVPEQRHLLKEYLMSSAEGVLKEGEGSCENAFDFWEYMIVHSLGRHYSHPNIVSKMTACEQRTASFDNDLFDFYCSLPPEDRINADMMRYAMIRLSPKIGKIPTGNYGIAAAASPLRKTLTLVGRKALRHLTGLKHLHAPDAVDRTWPDRDDYIRTHPEYLAAAKKAILSDEMRATMPFFDWPKIETQLPIWLSKPRGGGKFLASLMSVHGLIMNEDL